jgi:hypothetical protein
MVDGGDGFGLKEIAELNLFFIAKLKVNFVILSKVKRFFYTWKSHRGYYI